VCLLLSLCVWVRSSLSTGQNERWSDDSYAFRGERFTGVCVGGVYVLQQQHQHQQQQYRGALSYWKMNRHDARVRFSIGADQADGGAINAPCCLTFDHIRGRLYVADRNNRIQVFSAEDGSFLYTFQCRGRAGDKLNWVQSLAVDHAHDRLVVVDSVNHRLEAVSALDFSLVFHAGSHGGGPLEFQYPYGVCVDRDRHRIVVADTGNHRLQVLSSIDGSFLFEVGRKGEQQLEFQYPREVCFDRERRRIVVADTGNRRLQVLSSIDYSYLFEFGNRGDDGTLAAPGRLCIDNQGRTIVADVQHRQLQAFSSQYAGDFLTAVPCLASPSGVAFDESRGLIAFCTSEHQVHVIGANRWLPNTYVWRPERHRFAPKDLKIVVESMTTIRTLEHRSVVSWLPNEILFEIFKCL